MAIAPSGCVLGCCARWVCHHARRNRRATHPTRICDDSLHVWVDVGLVLDGVVHSIGFAPEAALGGNFLNTAWEDVATAIQVSAFSLKSLTMAARPLFNGGGSVVGLDFDGQVAWPKYDWMGVAKAALESTSRYLAKDLGAENIRINLVAAGPIRTIAAKSIPDFERFEHLWDERSPMRWDVNDPVPAAQAVVALLSDWFPKTTAEIIHVDGGFHAMGG